MPLRHSRAPCWAGQTPRTRAAPWARPLWPPQRRSRPAARRHGAEASVTRVFGEAPAGRSLPQPKTGGLEPSGQQTHTTARGCAPSAQAGPRLPAAAAATLTGSPARHRRPPPGFGRYLTRDCLSLQQKRILFLPPADESPFPSHPPLSAPFFSSEAQGLSLQKQLQGTCTGTGSEGKKRREGEAVVDGLLHNFSLFLGETVILPSLLSNRESLPPPSRSAQEGETVPAQGRK